MDDGAALSRRLAAGQVERFTGSSNPGCSCPPEAAGLEQASGDVVGQVAEPECGAAEVFEPVSAYDLTCRSAYDLTCRSVFGES